MHFFGLIICNCLLYKLTCAKKIFRKYYFFSINIILTYVIREIPVWIPRSKRNFILLFSLIYFFVLYIPTFLIWVFKIYKFNIISIYCLYSYNTPIVNEFISLYRLIIIYQLTRFLFANSHQSSPYYFNILFN